MQNNLITKRKVDITLCIDGTGSMRSCINSVKDNACRFYRELKREMNDMRSEFDILRIKVIVFRDFKCDGRNAMVESRFFELPADDNEFSAYLDGIRAEGGCDENAAGLEALYKAMTSDYIATGPKDREVIVLFADTTAIPLGVRGNCPGYPKDMVDADGLLETWMCVQSRPSQLRERNKRLVMFAPKGSCYEDMLQTYNRSRFIPVEIHRGLDDVSFDSIMSVIAASASSV